ncbi:MAG: NAD(P)H-binding protein [Ignavibacteria bacterium]|nr:NAD(P)H-binding protein [Ignavibacteria bacterium]MBK9228292.1 NAD(P)H-binding protein [Ignavibacteria bacterium]
MINMTATLIGATGLIGNYLLEELLKDPFFDTVRILIRRPMDKTDPKLEKKIVDFNDSDSLLAAINNSDVVFCTIGTTQKKVKGDKDAYYKIDFDIPVNLSRFCKMTGCEKFILVSSVGANSKSNNFYLKLKGETEEAVIASGIKAIHIMRPSVLLGERNESRLGEKIGKAVLSAFSFLTPSKYKPIQGKDVAKAMLSVSKKSEEGYFVHENAEIKKISSGDS